MSDQQQANYELEFDVLVNRFKTDVSKSKSANGVDLILEDYLRMWGSLTSLPRSEENGMAFLTKVKPIAEAVKKGLPVIEMKYHEPV